MRQLACASLILAALFGACSAVDNFDKFKFVDDGGTTGVDMSPPGFGDVCAGQCQVVNPQRPLSCFTAFGSRTIPGGMCTRTCTLGSGLLACNDYPDSTCVHVEGMDVCLPRCDPSQSRNCRTGLSCCANNNVVSNAGACAPATTDLCR
ncbi:MAG: hypothetical protein JWN44_4240 [Myxococcales bacterium]|nr:hypothetical protein [Myxococcales bacterium]